MRPSLQQQLHHWKQEHQESTPKKINTKYRGKHNSEEFTESDLRYLMSVNMRTLRRGKGGAWK